MPRTSYVEAAAADFARHSKGGGGWALGLAVAACVQDNNRGRPPESSDRNISGKITADDFASRANTSKQRVLRHLKGWQAAAAQGLVAPADSLTPRDWDDADHIPTGYDWAEFYDASEAGSRPRDSRPEHAAQIIDRRGADAVVAELNEAQVEAVVEAAVRRRPQPARQGMVRGMASRPEQPFDTPPVVGGDVHGMDADAMLTALSTRIGQIEGHITEHTEVWDDTRIGHLVHQSDQLHGCVLLARGAPDEPPRDWSEEVR